MPMPAKPNSVARLAMGTAMIAILAGCETRVGRAVSDLTAPTGPTVETVPVAAPSQTVGYAAPGYVLPGAPTYIEQSQAANVQTFESVYGPPVVDIAAGTYTEAAPAYAVPSYDDGTVLASPLSAPLLSSPAPSVQATYTQRVLLDQQPAAPLASVPATTFAAAPAVVAQPIDTGAFSFAETAPAPAPASFASAPIFGSASADFAAPAFDAMPQAAVATEIAPVMVDEPLTPGEELLGLDTTALAGLVDTAPSAYDVGPAIDTFETNTILDSGFDAIPVEQVYDDIPTPVALPAEYGASIGGDLSSLPAAAPAPVGFEVLSNDDAIRQFEGDAAPAMPAPDMLAPVSPSIFEDAAPADPSVGGQFQVISQATPAAAPASSPMTTFSRGATTMAPIADEGDFAAARTMPAAPVMAAVSAAVPEPRAKVAPAAPLGLAAVPTPRQRPARSERSYATLTTPLPQPRPAYEGAVAMATTAGKYVSIGSIDQIETTELAPMPAEPVEVASARLPEPAAPAAPAPTPARLSETSELSGTSWRLVSVNAMPVAANAELHFDGSSGFAGGQGPCNSYGGEFVNKGAGMFSMGSIFATEMACPSIEVEQRYIDALEKAERYSIEGNFANLTLQDANGMTVATFKAF